MSSERELLDRAIALLRPTEWDATFGVEGEVHHCRHCGGVDPDSWDKRDELCYGPQTIGHVKPKDGGCPFVRVLSDYAATVVE